MGDINFQLKCSCKGVVQSSLVMHLKMLPLLYFLSDRIKIQTLINRKLYKQLKNLIKALLIIKSKFNLN